MQLNLIQKNNETILPICFYGKNRNNEVLTYHKKVMDFFGISMNYLEWDFSRSGHGDAVQYLVAQTLNSNIDYYWFCDMDLLVLKREFIDIAYEKIKDKNTVYGPSLATNHRGFPNHIYAGLCCLLFSKQLYLELGSPDIRDIKERSDCGQEITWRCQEKGKNVCLMYPTSYYELTNEEMKETGNPRYFKLGEYFKYGLGTVFGGGLIMHGFMQNLKRSGNLIIEKAKEIIGEIKKGVKIEALIVSVNYADFLSITLPKTKKLYDNCIIITTPDDFETQKVCDENSVQYITTNLFYENNAKFDKGAALNYALGFLKYNDWVNFIDADCLTDEKFREKIDLNSLNKNQFFGSGRTFIYSYEDYLDYLEGRKTINDFQYIRGAGNGYWQLINLNSDVVKRESLENLYPSYPENVLIDILFLKKWCPLIENDKNLIDLGIDIIHLSLHSIFKNGRGKEARFDYFKDKKFKDIKRNEIQKYIEEINK